MYKNNWDKFTVAKLKKIIIQKGRGKVLDIGAKDGSSQSFFNENWNWFGIDIDPVSDDVKYGDAQKLDFKDSTFDLVICRATLHYLPEPLNAVTEAYRVLKKGGIYFGSVAFLEPEHGNSHFHMTRHGISFLLKKVNFREIDVIPVKNWTIVNSPRLLPGFTIYTNIKSKMIFLFRKLLIKTVVAFRSGDSKLRAIKYLEDDVAKYSGSFIFKSRK